MSVKAEVTLSDAVAKAVESEVAAGRYADFSSAIQEAAWNYFVGPVSVLEEYGLKPEEVDAAYERDTAKIDEARAKGTLKRWE